jgi:hypothetical protein
MSSSDVKASVPLTSTGQLQGIHRLLEQVQLLI